jgi:hypothetical protein
MNFRGKKKQDYNWKIENLARGLKIKITKYIQLEEKI